MRSRLQLDVRNLSLGRRHLVNAYEVKAGIGVIAGNTVWSIPERLKRFHDWALYKSILLTYYIAANQANSAYHPFGVDK